MLCCVVLCCVWSCVAPRVVGRAALVCGPPQGGACCGGVCPRPMAGRALSVRSGFGSWCFSRLDARLVLLVRCCLRRLTAGVVGCRVYLSFAWPGQTGRPPERVWCASPFLLAGTDGPASRARAVRHPVFLFRGFRRPAARVPLLALPFLVSARLPAVFCCLGPPAAAPPPLPHPTPQLTPPGPRFVFRGCGRPAACLPLFSFCFLVALRRWAVGPPSRFCDSGSSLCCLAPAGDCVLCWLVVCFAVLCCCLLCYDVRGAVCRVVLCRVSLSFAGGVVLRCVSSCGFVPSGVRWRCAVGCVLCCAVPCCAVLRCCLLLCAVLRLWAWCLIALRCPVLVVACCFVLGAVLCAVLCLLMLCPAVSRRVVLYGALLFCTVLWGWCCAALFRGMWCRFGLWRALGCCAVPRVLCALLRAVLCCAVALCFVLCLGVLCLGALCCAVRVVSGCFVGSVFLCVVLCLSVLFCAALRRVVTCGTVLLRTVLLAWCCAGFSRAFWCCCVLCPALGCCAVLWGPVPFGVALCCVALCCVRCSACVLPLCCGVCCYLQLSVALLAPCGVALCARLPPCISKNRKTVSCQHALCPVVSCCALPAVPACNNTTH